MNNQKSTGIRRRVDEMGRITIPSELRMAYGIQTDTPIQITLQGDTIVLEPIRHHCCICGESDAEYQIYPASWICQKCMELIKQQQFNSTGISSDSSAIK